MKQMTKKILINLDKEAEEKLNDLAKDSDKSKAARRAILLAWDVKNDCIRVPLVGTIGKAGSYNGHTIIEPAPVETFPSAALETESEL